MKHLTASQLREQQNREEASLKESESKEQERFMKQRKAAWKNELESKINNIKQNWNQDAQLASSKHYDGLVLARVMRDGTTPVPELDELQSQIRSDGYKCDLIKHPNLYALNNKQTSDVSIPIGTENIRYLLRLETPVLNVTNPSSESWLVVTW